MSAGARDFCKDIVPAPTDARRGCAPSSALLPMSGPTRPTPGVPFVSRRKEPKACRGCAPGPPEGDASLPLQHIVLLPPQKGLCH